MARPGLLERIVKVLSKDYLTLEMWSRNKNQADLLPYAKKIAMAVERAHPGTHVLWRRPAKVDYFWAGFLAFDGYRFYVSKTVDPIALKRTCMRLELDQNGERMADIDVYCGNEKVSRKHGTYSFILAENCIPANKLCRNQ